MALTRVQTRRDAEAEAWATYRSECDRVPEWEYDEREPYAWRRRPRPGLLQQRRGTSILAVSAA